MNFIIEEVVTDRFHCNAGIFMLKYEYNELRETFHHM